MRSPRRPPVPAIGEGAPGQHPEQSAGAVLVLRVLARAGAQARIRVTRLDDPLGNQPATIWVQSFDEEDLVAFVRSWFAATALGTL